MGKMFWLVGIFLVIGGYMIVSNSNLDLDDESDRKTFYSSFKDWILNLGGNVKDVSAYAVKELDWLPTNESGDDNESG